jgi:hypothetical protein
MTISQPPRKRHWIRWTLITAAAVIATFVIVGAIASTGSGHGNIQVKKAASSSTPAAPATAPATPAAASPPAASPEGKATWSCDEDLGSSSIYSPTYLTGEADLSNTGNVGIVVTVRFAWHQEAYPDVTAPVKTVRIRAGQDKVARFRYYAGTFAGSTQPLDRYDSWQSSHSGMPCHASVHIVSTFGAVQG